jgi:hypothetical protein
MSYFIIKVDEIMGEWRKLHNEVTLLLPNIVGAFKLKGRRMAHLACMKEVRNGCEVLV